MLRFARNAAVRDRRAAHPQPDGRGDQPLPIRRRGLAGDGAAGGAAGAAKSGLRAACDLFDEIAAAAGLTAVNRSGQGEAKFRYFELDADTRIETRD